MDGILVVDAWQVNEVLVEALLRGYVIKEDSLGMARPLGASQHVCSSHSVGVHTCSFHQVLGLPAHNLPLLQRSCQLTFLRMGRIA